MSNKPEIAACQNNMCDLNLQWGNECAHLFIDFDVTSCKRYTTTRPIESELQAEIEKLSQQVCDECSPDDYGWVENRVEGRVPCVCITESGAYQALEAEIKELREALGEAVGWNWLDEDHPKDLLKQIEALIKARK